MKNVQVDLNLNGNSITNVGNMYTRDEVDKKVVELTKDEYDALSEEEKNSGSIYFVPDAESLSNDTKIITELNELVTDQQVPSAKAVYNEINALNKDLDDLILMDLVSCGQLVVPANGETSTTVDIFKDGYKPICATINTTGNAKCFCYALRVITESETLNVGFHNTYTADLTITPQAQVVYKKV